MSKDQESSLEVDNFYSWLRRESQLARRTYERTLSVARKDFVDFGKLPGGKWVPIAVVLLVTVLFSLFRIGSDDVFTESILFMILGLGLGLFSRTTGILFVATHAVFDLIAEASDLTLSLLIARLISFWLLSALVITIPNVQRLVAALIIRSRFGERLRDYGALVVSSLIVPPLIYLWAIAASYLIRPVFSGNPSVAAIEPLWKSNLAFAGISLLLSLFISLIYQRRVGLRLEPPPLQAMDRKKGRFSLLRRLVLYALAIVALSGLITNALDVFMLFGGLFGGEVLAAFLMRVTALRNLMRKIPYPVRFLGAFLGTFALANLIMNTMYRPIAGSEFFPLVLAIAAGFLLFQLLLGVDEAALGAETANRKGYGLSFLIIGFFLMFALPDVAYADNCSGLSDCAKYALSCTAAAAAAIAAFIGRWIKGVFFKTPIPDEIIDPDLAEGIIAAGKYKLVINLLGMGYTEEANRIKYMTKGEWGDFAREHKGETLEDYVKTLGPPDNP